MSKRSNNQGRGYEYACLYALYDEIGKIRPISIIENSSFIAALKAWNTLTESEQNTYRLSAKAIIPTLCELEPRIIDGTDTLEMYLQKDEAGKQADVRDIIILRSNIQWEIGLSIKHNSFAQKHNRLSKTLDFGAVWFGYPCSQNYWNAIEPTFAYLEQEKAKQTLFRQLPNKSKDVYRPLMQAFLDELKSIYAQHSDVPQKLVEYVLSKYDFYKVISIDRKETTQIQAYNLHKSLNKPSSTKKATRQVPISLLPKRIISIDFQPKRNNTIEVYLDNGWSFSFRIHNAETIVCPSLKFDVKTIGMPTSILTINCIWK